MEPHRTFPKPVKKIKEKKASSIGKVKGKKPQQEWKQNLFPDHKAGKSSKDRAEFPPSIVKELSDETDGICQQCLSAPGTTTHHVWPRGRKGRGVKTNGIRFCGPCHDIVQITDELLQYWISVFRERHGDYFWFDEADWNEHARKQAMLQQAEKEREERLKQIEPVVDLIATAAGRVLRIKEIRLLESLETNDLQVFTGMFTDALNGYVAQGNYHPQDRFED